MKIKPGENLSDKIFYLQQIPDLQYDSIFVIYVYNFSLRRNQILE